MRFLTDNDYTPLIREEIKDILLENYSETKLLRAEDMAVAQVKNYLSGRYDMEQVFTLPEGNDDTRNAHIVMTVVDCALYHLYTSIAPDRLPKIRSDRYQDALDWLKEVGKGQMNADLPVYVDETTGEEELGFKIGSIYENEENRW